MLTSPPESPRCRGRAGAPSKKCQRAAGGGSRTLAARGCLLLFPTSAEATARAGAKSASRERAIEKNTDVKLRLDLNFPRARLWHPAGEQGESPLSPCEQEAEEGVFYLGSAAGLEPQIVLSWVSGC